MRSVLKILVLPLVVVGHLPAQGFSPAALPRITPPGRINCSAWTSVTGWKGTFSYSGVGSGEIAGASITVNLEVAGDIALTGTQAPCPPTTPLNWGTSMANMQFSYSQTIVFPCLMNTVTANGDLTGAVILQADLAAMNYQLMPLVGSTTITATETETPTCPSGDTISTTIPLPLASLFSSFPTFSLPATPPKALSQALTVPSIAPIAGFPLNYTFSFNLTPMVSCQVDPSRLAPLSQADPAWGSDQYDKHDKNDPRGYSIARWGCALTSLTMAINYANGATPGSPGFLTPGDLNTFMNSQPGAFDGGSVNWGPAVASTTAGTIAFTANRVDSQAGANAAAASAVLDSFLCVPDPHPVIVGVKQMLINHTDGTTEIIPGHYVLVTGKDPVTGDYHIIDPYPATGINTLSGYGNDYSTRGAVIDPVDLSRLDIASDDNVSLTLIDPSGNRTGLDPVSRHVIQNIPQSAYFTDAILNDVTGDGLIGPTSTVDVFQPASPGVYSIVARGLESSPYSVTVTIVSPTGGILQSFTWSGQAQPGSIDTTTLNFNSGAASSTTTPMPGDRNGDGRVDCTDLNIVKTAFGTSRGQPGFDPRADVNGDGVVNILDLTVVARALPPGTVCAP
jgi:hypothetical protein